jgi:hypothetical protein
MECLQAACWQPGHAQQQQQQQQLQQQPSNRIFRMAAAVGCQHGVSASNAFTAAAASWVWQRMLHACAKHLIPSWGSTSTQKLQTVCLV